MSTNNKKKKGRAMFMKRSYLKVWTDQEGKIHSKAKGSIQQIISNYNDMIKYMRDQATSMVGSAVLTLGQTPDVVIAMATENPKMNPKSFRTQVDVGPGGSYDPKSTHSLTGGASAGPDRNNKGV